VKTGYKKMIKSKNDKRDSGTKKQSAFREGVNALGRTLRATMFYTAQVMTLAAYFIWLIAPPVYWFSKNSHHSHTETYWAGGYYLVMVIGMTWFGWLAFRLFKAWNSRRDLFGGYFGIFVSIPIIFAPAIPLGVLSFISVYGGGGGDSEEYWWESNPLYNRAYGSNASMGSFNQGLKD